jgi:hypothetical protein
VLGGRVEICVRHWLNSYIPLADERILAWEQRQRNGRHTTLYRELDAVWQIDDESICLYEMKLTFPENMENGVGLRQLETASDILNTCNRYRYILQRLVYVGDEKVTVLDGLPELEADDENAELGVIWVPPDAVEAAAKELEIALPEDWLDPESREGDFEDPEREAWKQFADTSSQESDAENPDNPLADALRRALERNKQ